MWKSKLFKQTGICLLIVLAFFAAQKSNIPQLNRGSEAAVAYLSKNYTVSECFNLCQRQRESSRQSSGSRDERSAICRGGIPIRGTD